MDVYTGTLRVTADTPNLIKDASVTRSVDQINKVTDNTFKFTLTNPIPTTGYYKIHIPQEAQLIENTSFTVHVKTTSGEQAHTTTQIIGVGTGDSHIVT